jgi:hypothetical protein
MAGGVRYGMIGEPAGPDKVSADAPDEPGPQPEVPEEAVRQLTQALGPSFLIFRDRVQKELNLSKDQARKLRQRLPETIQDAMQFFQKLSLSNRKPEERDRELASYRQKAHEKLATFLKETLNLKEDQLRRLRQVELQHDGPFALGRPEVARELKITEEQRKQFMAVVQEMQRQIEPLIKEAQSGKGKPEEIWPKVMTIRMEHEGKVEAILSAEQKTQWKAMLGKALALDD